jgi:hypothetical protein
MEIWTDHRWGAYVMYQIGRMAAIPQHLLQEDKNHGTTDG